MSGHAEFRFTVFTPTYNRCASLTRVYESLKAQTFRDFEWLIVDDGSTDRTAERVPDWQAEGKVNIQYVAQPNQGKHIAFNNGVAHARGELFLTLDSDDACMPDALETFNAVWESIPQEDRGKRYAAVTGLATDQEGKLIGSRFPTDVFDSTPQECHYRYKVQGEKWGFTCTNILRRFPFPDLGVKFVPEGVVWAQIGRRYLTRYVNRPLRIYHVRKQGEEDEGKMSSSPAAYAKSMRYWVRSCLVDDLDWLHYSPMMFLKFAALYVRYSMHDGVPVARQFFELSGSGAKLLWIIGWPVGAVAYWRDRTRG
jgi:glycosyltransferase involved in cell wall biosynthesis